VCLDKVSFQFKVHADINTLYFGNVLEVDVSEGRHQEHTVTSDTKGTDSKLILEHGPTFYVFKFFRPCFPSAPV
jgi:hypothetical protein